MLLRDIFSKFSFKSNNEHVFVKCIYAPNDEMNSTGPDNESKTFFKEVFDDSDKDKYTHKATVGDFNVALRHTYDTSGYLHINKYTFGKKTSKKLH